MLAKFRANAGADGDELGALLLELDEIDDVGQLTALLRAGAVPA